MIVDKPVPKSAKCDFSTNIDKKGNLAPQVRKCNKPAKSIYRDDNFPYVEAYICDDCRKRVVRE